MKQQALEGRLGDLWDPQDMEAGRGTMEGCFRARDENGLDLEEQRRESLLAAYLVF